MVKPQKTVITGEVLNRVRQKFIQDSEMMYEEALMKHRNLAQGGIPVLMWVVLAWYASDNIIGYF